ncbi:putative HNH endonuclease [Pectobacterium phage PP47]|uniref:HNH endonuclease n=2 Tax=Pektosvirus TaxID=2732689 RepID=A0A1P8L686_9CAUD|nr:putative HNH endonuclease [Pectobacterium phage PP81]YP_009788734.1 putative HNH endonuclease [Pectobacterium phage PP47]APU03070.1 putative HNH endonuclease [Pectobacterium phage PP81]APW79772.1 putative HNH endonuclease [Pectobacterium phage PP47]
MVTYNPLTGEMRTIRGKIPNVDTKGYYVLWFQGKLQRAHRVAWFLTYGYWPEIIDHINRDRKDNRLVNLREATESENHCNVPKYSNNTSGHKGVFPHGDRWRVQVRKDGKVRSFGLYEDLELAALVAEEAREKLHGSFVNN